VLIISEETKLRETAASDPEMHKYLKAIEVNPKDLDAKFGLAELQVKYQMFTEAIQNLLDVATSPIDD
jgi:thioredoxin-like negative regulator of GroEL